MCACVGRICTYFSLILVGTPPPWRIFHTIVEITVVTAITMTTITTTTPATTEGVLLGDEQTASVEGGGVLEHSGSLGEVIATEQLASIVISTPVTMTLAPPPLTQASIRETRELLSVAEVPSSLAR